jgi:hypothetical protein
MGDNVSEPLDCAHARRILPEGNVSTYFIVIGGVFRKNSPKVFCIEHDQMIRTLAPDRADQAFSISILPGWRNDVGRSRIPIARTRALNATPNALSLSRMRYFGALSHGNASVICRANHSAVGLRVTASHNKRRRSWLRTRNANSC